MYITLHVKHQSEPRTPRQPSNAQNTTGTRIPENRAEYLTFIQKSTFTLNRPHNCLQISPKQAKHRNTIKTPKLKTEPIHL